MSGFLWLTSKMSSSGDNNMGERWLESIGHFGVSFGWHVGNGSVALISSWQPKVWD